MKIIARIDGKNQSLVAALIQRRIIIKLVKGGEVMIELPARMEGSWNNPDAYEVPAEVNDATLFLDVAEDGGGMPYYSWATVVCGLSGEALRPYHVSSGDRLTRNAHAYFSVPNAVVTVTGFRDDYVTIEEYWIVRDGNIARIKSKKLWNGQLKALPELFSRFKAAAEAASAKSNCYHCRCVHFAEAM